MMEIETGNTLAEIIDEKKEFRLLINNYLLY